MSVFIRFIKAWLKVRWARWRGYETILPARMQDHRMEICEGCPHFDDGLCTVCKCLTYAKVMLATESCPKGFWKSVWLKKL